jgi:hypothetical protein
MDTLESCKIKCEICKEQDFKYKCPACSLKTCSLKCCQSHKQLNSCTGQRDKTKFVKLQEFSERELMSDYNFLEEQSRLVDNTQRDILKRKYDITSSMDYLKHLAFKQSKTVLQFMPRHSTKRLANRTRFDKMTKIISWHVELRFALGQVYSLNDLCSSKMKLSEVLCNFYKENEFNLFLDDQPLHGLQVEFKKLTEGEESGLNILYEMRNFTLKCKYYLKFNLDRMLEENLFKKTVIEYPVFHVVLSKDLEKFNIKKEEEIVKEVQSYQCVDDKTKIVEKCLEKEEGECEENDDDDDDDEENVDDDESYEDGGDAKKPKFLNDNFETEIEFDQLKNSFSEAGICFEKI